MYNGTSVTVDDDGVTIRGYGFFGSEKRVAFTNIQSVTEFDLGWMGRWRLIGAGFNAPRRWFSWDSQRKTKSIGFAFDVGRFWIPTVTPDDPAAFREELSTRKSAYPFETEVSDG
jgi:hypothetical protein